MTRIAVNRMATGKIPPGDARWATFNDSFCNCERSLMDFANDVYTGHSYTAWHQGRRSIENFLLAEHIAVDMDSGDKRSSFDALLKHDFVRMYASLIHTTPSHTTESPRARVVFFLDEPITDALGYQTAAKFLVSLFDGADEACTDASRFFYGSLNCDIWFSENVLPVQQLRHYYRQWAKHGKVATPPQENIIKLQDYRPSVSRVDALVEPVRSARQGQRNSTLNRQAFLAGKDIRAGLLRQAEIEPLLLRAALASGLDEQEARHTIASGFSGGRKAVG